MDNCEGIHDETMTERGESHITMETDYLCFWSTCLQFYVMFQHDWTLRDAEDQI